MQMHCVPGIQRPKNPRTDQTHLVTRAFPIQFINPELSFVILRSSMRTFSLLLQQLHMVLSQFTSGTRSLKCQRDPDCSRCVTTTVRVQSAHMLQRYTKCFRSTAMSPDLNPTERSYF